MSLKDLLLNWTQLRKESLSKRIYQQNPQKTKKQREQGLKKTEQNIQGPWDSYKKKEAHT